LPAKFINLLVVVNHKRKCIQKGSRYINLLANNQSYPRLEDLSRLNHINSFFFLGQQLIHAQSHEIAVYQLPIVGNAAHAKRYIKTSSCPPGSTPPPAPNQIFQSYQRKSSATTQALAMATNTRLLVAVLAVVYTVVTPTMAARVTAGRWLPAGVPGGFSPISNINDRHIQELGGWAVSEHDKKANDGIKFKRVVSGDVQVVEGLNYRLIIDASDGSSKDATYEAMVWEMDWVNFRELTSFKPAK
jgi:hypothetical protein